MINIDMWYGDNPGAADMIDISFYDLDLEYRGNIYKNNRVIGSYECTGSLELKKAFPHLKFSWR